MQNITENSGQEHMVVVYICPMYLFLSSKVKVLSITIMNISYRTSTVITKLKLPKINYYKYSAFHRRVE